MKIALALVFALLVSGFLLTENETAAAFQNPTRTPRATSTPRPTRTETKTPFRPTRTPTTPRPTRDPASSIINFGIFPESFTTTIIGTICGVIILATAAGLIYTFFLELATRIMHRIVDAIIPPRR